MVPGSYQVDLTETQYLFLNFANLFIGRHLGRWVWQRFEKMKKCGNDTVSKAKLDSFGMKGLLAISVMKHRCLSHCFTSLPRFQFPCLPPGCPLPAGPQAPPAPHTVPYVLFLHTGLSLSRKNFSINILCTISDLF